MAVGSAISSPLGPASCDKDAKALQFIEETTRNADLVQERDLAEILARNANTEYLKRFNLNGATDRDSFKSKLPVITYEDLQPEIQRIANGDCSPILSAHPISEFLTSVNSDEAVSSTTRLKDAKALQFIEETTRNADLVQERVLAEILARNANTESEYLKRFNLNGGTDRDSFKSKLPIITYEDLQPEIQRIANGDRSPSLSAHPFSESLTSVTSDKAVSSTTRLKASISNAFHAVSTSSKEAVIKEGQLIYKARDLLLNRLRGGGGGGEGGDGEEGDVEDRGGDKKNSRTTPEMLPQIATTTIANTAQIFGSAISLKVRDLALSSKVLLILVMATGLAGYLFSITAILQMHKRQRFSHGLVWTGCAATTLGLLIVIVVFVLEL